MEDSRGKAGEVERRRELRRQHPWHRSSERWK